jgi:hypothetical protein
MSSKSKRNKGKENTKGFAANNSCNPYFLSAICRKAGPMEETPLEGRQGAKNRLPEYMEEYQDAIEDEIHLDSEEDIED